MEGSEFQKLREISKNGLTSVTTRLLIDAYEALQKKASNLEEKLANPDWNTRKRLHTEIAKDLLIAGLPNGRIKISEMVECAGSLLDQVDSFYEKRKDVLKASVDILSEENLMKMDKELSEMDDIQISDIPDRIKQKLWMIMNRIRDRLQGNME
jgi:hypothetical protein